MLVEVDISLFGCPTNGVLQRLGTVKFHNVSEVTRRIFAVLNFHF